MPLLVAEAAKLSQEDLVRGVIEEIIDRDDLFALLPFVKTNGKAYTYKREGTLSEASFISPYDTVPEGAATFTEVTALLKILAGDVDLDKFLIQTQSDHNDQLAIQLASKAKGLARKLRRTIAIGDSSSNVKEFDGIAKLVTPAQTLVAGANGAALTLQNLDELMDQVINGADCLMMRRGTWRAVRALLRSFGGNTAETVMVENFGRPIQAYNGMPVIMNDFLPATEVQGSSSNTCSIYALRLNEVDGLHGIYGGDSAGVVVEEIGTIQNQDAVRWRTKWYVGLALKSTQSMARLKGVTNV
jgi:HK97 family phage major capsid protein